MISEVQIKTKVKIHKTNAFVHKIFNSFNTARIEYCLLRGYEELFKSEVFLEIDLLVNPEQMALLTVTVAELGFLELPSWGHAPHKFFVVFDKNRGDWIKLDIVTELRYGKPIRRFQIDLVEPCLQERQFDRLYTLSPANEFFTLFLHCLLDKAKIRPDHRIRLLELCEFIKSDWKLEQRVCELMKHYLSPIFNWQNISQAIEKQNWQALLTKRSDVVHEFRRREPILSFWRNFSARLIKRLRPFFFAFKQRGISVALLAPDGAGKSTLASKLIHDPILKSRRVYMGGNIEANTVRLPLTSWLHKQLKSLKDTSGPQKTLLVFIIGLNFCNKLLEQWLRAFSAYYHLLRGRMVVFDRYIYDSWVNKKKNTLWKRIRRWLFEGGLPEPDLVIFMDAPGKVLFERKGEHSSEWLEQQRQAYLGLKERIPQMQVVDASLPVDAVRREVVQLIWQKYVSKVKN